MYGPPAFLRGMRFARAFAEERRGLRERCFRDGCLRLHNNVHGEKRKTAGEGNKMMGNGPQNGLERRWEAPPRRFFPPNGERRAAFRRRKKKIMVFREHPLTGPRLLCMIGL